MGKVLAALLGLMILALAVIVLLPTSVWKNLIVRSVTSATGRQAAIDGNVQLHVFTWHPEIIVEGFRLANPAWSSTKEMLEVQRLDVVFSLASLFKFHLIFPKVAVESPTLALERDATGRANWDFTTPGNARKPGRSAPTHIPVIQQLSITDGKLSAVDQVRKLKFQGQVSVQEKHERSAQDESALNLRGNGMLNAKPFELKVAGGPLIDVDPGKPYSFDLSVTAADIKLTAHTDIAHPFDLATVRSKFEVKGQDLADVYYLSGLALPNTPPYDIAGTLDRDNLTFKVDDLRGTVGSSDISGQLTIDTSHDRPKLTAQLTSKQLNFADLAAPLGTQASPQQKSNSLAQPQALEKGASAAKRNAPPPVNKAELLLPDADLQVSRVRAMDADVTFEAASIVTAKLPMKKVRFHLLLNAGRLSLDPLSFTLPQGTFSGTVAIDAHSSVPQTDIDMKLEHVDLAQFKPQSSTTAPFEGQLVGRIRLHGAGASVHKAAANADGDITLVIPSGEMREALAELAGINLSRGLGLLLAKDEKDTALRCGVANFHAGDGDLKATTLVIDTTNVLVTGSGQIDLKTESLDLALKGAPKKARLLRLRTPITVHGSLSHPVIGVDPAKVAVQAGSAVALGALLTPVAALLAFVDGGLAKDANCSALISNAEQGKNLAAAATPRERR